MTEYTLRRLLHAVFVVWGAVTVIFVIVRLVPADPALLILGPTATEDQLASMRAHLGVDRGLVEQYFLYLLDVVRLDFGESFRLGGSAIGHVFERLPATVQLATASLIIAVLLSFPLGIFAALRPQSWLDKLVATMSLVGQSLPTFWVGIMLVLIFARYLEILPSGGAGGVQHLLLPAFTLALPFMSVMIRLVRSGLLEVLPEGYVQTAKAKGLSRRIVVYRHAVRNMLIPVVTVGGLQLGNLLAGTVIVEVVFAWPGIGRLLFDAISNRDYPVVQATIAIIAAAFVLINLMVDLFYTYLDPRIRTE